MTFKELESGAAINPNAEIYIYVEGHSQWLAGGDWSNYPQYVQHPPVSFEKIYSNDKHILVYKVASLADLKAALKSNEQPTTQ